MVANVLSFQEHTLNAFKIDFQTDYMMIIQKHLIIDKLQVGF